MRHVLTVLSICVAASLPRDASAQAAPDSAQVGIVVSNAATKAPIEDAELTVDSAPRTLRSDYVGEINFARKRNTAMRLRVRKAGFASLDTTITVGNVDWIQVILALAPSAQPLPVTEVTAAPAIAGPPDRRLVEFERRRAQGKGRYFTPEQMTRAMDKPLLPMLLQFPGLQTMTATSGIVTLVHKGGPTSFIEQGYRKNYNVIVRGDSAAPKPPVGGGARERETNEQQPALCELAVFIDGMYIASPDISRLRAAGFTAVEYYTPSNTPPEFRRAGSQCGVVLLWSR